MAAYAGIVVLGGALYTGSIWETRRTVLLNEAAERMTEPVALLRAFPHLQLVYTGGEVDPKSGKAPQARQAMLFFKGMGIEEPRVIYEHTSTTTYENSTFTAVLPGMDIHRPWLLLTSAAHMPRALATFRHTGWNVTPYPVDYQTGASTSLTKYSLVKGLGRWQTVCYESLAWILYLVRGRI
ncbi:MAG: YdcF family protein [Burkholderiales bacterium]|nr:YdcF family protein [Burkholderiales bacterium]